MPKILRFNESSQSLLNQKVHLQFRVLSIITSGLAL